MAPPQLHSECSKCPKTASSGASEAIRPANNCICAATASISLPQALPPPPTPPLSIITPAPVSAASDAVNQRHRAEPTKTASIRPVPLRSGSHRSRLSEATSKILIWRRSSHPPAWPLWAQSDLLCPTRYFHGNFAPSNSEKAASSSPASATKVPLYLIFATSTPMAPTQTRPPSPRSPFSFTRLTKGDAPQPLHRRRASGPELGGFLDQYRVRDYQRTLGVAELLDQSNGILIFHKK